MSAHLIQRSSTKDLRPDLVATLKHLKEGDPLRIRQKIQINTLHVWETETVGVFRRADYLNTGLATDRVRQDDIVVVCIHILKDNGELSSVTLDENTELEVVGK